jgi:hypothetical protein
MKKNLREIKLPPGWKATVEKLLRESIRDNPEKLKEALRILDEKPAPEDRGEDACDSFAKAALREFIPAGATDNVEDIRCRRVGPYSASVHDLPKGEYIFG